MVLASWYEEEAPKGVMFLAAPTNLTELTNCAYSLHVYLETQGSHRLTTLFHSHMQKRDNKTPSHLAIFTPFAICMQFLEVMTRLNNVDFNGN